MHICEGALSGSTQGMLVLGAGAALTAVGTAVGLWRMDYHHMPRVAMLGSAFFVASLITMPVGPVYVHPVLNGLMGLLLGWAAFPAILVALLLQAVFFQFGGLTTLGTNTLNMALPAVVCGLAFGPAVRARSDSLAAAAAFAAGVASIVLAALLMAGSFWLAGREYYLLSTAIVVAHLAVAVVEGLISGSVVLFLRKVRPELLGAPLLAARPEEPTHGR